MSPPSECRRALARPYELLLARMGKQAGLAEDETPPLEPRLRARLLELQANWMVGLLGHQCESSRYGLIEIKDFGIWNRHEGPDFLQARVCIGGEERCGAVVFSLEAADWQQRHFDSQWGHEHIVLHVCVQPPDAYWRSVDAQLAEVPYMVLDATVWRAQLGLSEPLDAQLIACCQRPLEDLELCSLDAMFRAAASWRMERKRLQFDARKVQLGEHQAWYEAWAEVLGYHANRFAMKSLARRAPLALLEPGAALAILMGTAGFLSAKLKEDASEEARAYHRQIWDGWWSRREAFALAPSRQMAWELGAGRPSNHPHRRLAALAATAERWAEFSACLQVEKWAQLREFVLGLKDAFWQRHSSLPSVRLGRDVKLVGEERLRAFLVNYLLVLDESPQAWDLYLQQREGSVPQKVKRLANLLCGPRADLEPLLKCCYVQQAILQLEADFACQRSGRRGLILFPEELGDFEPQSHSC